MTNRRGRPPLDPNSPSVGVGLKMSSAQYDDTYRRARESRMTVTERIREDIRAGSEGEKKQKRS
jgi:hypothetical protein